MQTRAPTDPGGWGAAGGRYDVCGALAAGRTSMVFVARDEAAGPGAPPVILKRPHPGLVRDPHIRRAFAREVLHAASVQHPHVVPVRQHGADGDGPYLAMDLVLGVSLQRLQTVDLDDRSRLAPVPSPVAVAILLDVLGGLGAVHRAAEGPGRPGPLVHGDVSASNLMIGADGSARLIDFGQSVPVGDGPVPAPYGLGGPRGTASPEALAGEPLTPASDLFAAGVVLWEMLAGCRAFAASGPLGEGMRADLPPVADVRGVAPTTPNRIAAVCGRALEADPARRYGSAEEMAAELASACVVARGAPRADTVAAFVRLRSSPVLAQVRRLVETPTSALRSGVRRKKASSSP